MSSPQDEMEEGGGMATGRGSVVGLGLGPGSGFYNPEVGILPVGM